MIQDCDRGQDSGQAVKPEIWTGQDLGSKGTFNWERMCNEDEGRGHASRNRNLGQKVKVQNSQSRILIDPGHRC